MERVVFGETGALMAGHPGTSPVVVLSVPDGEVVATAPRFGTYADRDGKQVSTSDWVNPVGFVGEQGVLLEGSSTLNSSVGYAWSWPAGPALRHLGSRLAATAHRPERWRSALCALAAQGRFNTAQAAADAGRRVCDQQ